MRWESETPEQIFARQSNWHEWFAWKPVFQKDKDKCRWVWWESVYRRRNRNSPGLTDKISWEYCFDDFELIKRTAEEQERLQQINNYAQQVSVTPPSNPAAGTIWVNHGGNSGHSGILGGSGSYVFTGGGGGGGGAGWTLITSSTPVSNQTTSTRPSKKKPNAK